MPPVSEPLRRSPRLSLSPSPTPTSLGERNSPHHQALALFDFPDPQPLKIYHPNSSSPKPHKKSYLLHASSSAKRVLRRSPRLLGASIGVSDGLCGSDLLLNLPEKKACQLARACLDDSDLSIKSLRSRNLRVTSSSPAVLGKRQLGSGRSSDETPVNQGLVRRSPRFSGEKIVDERDGKLGEKCEDFSLASSSSSMAVGLGKCRRLDSWRHSEEMSVRKGFVRRSPRFSDERDESIGDANGKMVRDFEDAPLALPSSSMVEKSGKFRQLDSRKDSEFHEEMPVNRESLRRSRRFSGPEAGESPTRKELIGAAEGERVRNRKNSKCSEKMPVNREFGRRSPRLCGPEAVESSTRKELVGEAEGVRTRNRKDSKFSEETPVSGDETQGRIEIIPLPLLNSIMEEIFKTNEEERVPRRSPRGLSSICMVDDYECDEMKDLPLPISMKRRSRIKQQERGERK